MVDFKKMLADSRKAKRVHLDFETRSECNIWEAGAWVYSQHPSTQILCLAYAIDEGPVKILTYDDFLNFQHFGFPCEDLIQAIRDGALMVAHNALFEESIWVNQMVPIYGFPRIPIKQWRCTMAKALARALPRSLKDCGAALGAAIQKDNAGYRVMMKMCKPRPDGTYYEDAGDFQKLYAYCGDDVEAERCIDQMLPELTPDEQNIWFLDQLINMRGIYVDSLAIEKALEYSESFAKRLNETVSSISDGQLDGVSRRMAVLSWCNDQGVPISGYTKKDVAAVLANPDLPERVRTVLDTRVQLGKTSNAKYSSMRDSTCADGRIRDILIYHGATTGRWAGKLIQLQNLPKGNVKDTDTAIEILHQSSLDEFEIFYPDVMGTLSSCIRGMIKAAPGNKLLIADYAAIEARVVMWLAEEEYGLKQFRDFDAGTGQEPYITMAQDIYNRRDIPHKGPERQLGKTTILGCGFGMGSDKFIATCASWGIPITRDIGEKAVATYRTIYPRVPRSWYAQESAAIKCVQTKQDINCGKVRWEFDGSALLCRLPSGRALVYNDPSLEYVDTPWKERKLALHFMGVESKTKSWKREHTYGGKLVENITQAVARDIMAPAMFRAECNGYSISFSVHDEIVCEVPTSFGDVASFEKLLCILPKWAQGLPIKAKGFVSERYRKD
jgi:DNA polymerase